MMKNHEREKLLNAIIFFAQNTHDLGEVKLWALLYFLDFQHYRDVGRPVTGLQYFASPQGPASVELRGLNFKPHQSEFDAGLFSKRELRLLESLATQFRDSSTGDIIEVTRRKNRPWDEVFNVQGKKQANIPYQLACRSAELRQIEQLYIEHVEMSTNFSDVRRLA